MCDTGGRYPTTSAANCSAVAGGCTAHLDSCVCVATVQTTAVFSGGAVPTVEQAVDLLHIGSFAPDVYDEGTYELCTSSACNAADGVAVFTRGGSGDFDEETIRAAHGALPHRAPSTRCTAESMHHV